MSSKYYTGFVEFWKKLRKLESYKDYITIKNGIPNAELYDPEKCYSRLPKLVKMKNLEIMYSIAKEW